ncbi:MAG: rhomboid family intramembrane serine protease [Calditrichia bacterium]|jgi:membrane associated rhomboid family serine protease|nr:rhomboid family intramembrane serine protease [Calditrichia bacterium]
MYYQKSGFGLGRQLTPVVKNILFANGIVFLMSLLNVQLYNFISDNFALRAYDVFYQFKVWQLGTYMFIHGGFWHLFFNMFIFWMFGTELEMEWGSKQFLKYYFICGVGAGILNILFTSSPTIGASGAVYGIMVAYALRYPDRLVYIYFLFPVKVKYLVGFLALITFFNTWNPQADGIAHAAHLGGILIGYIYLKFWHKIPSLKSIFQPPVKKPKSSPSDDKMVEYYRRRIDELLDKINKVGYLNLNEEEKEELEKGSKFLREHDEKNYH